MRKQSLPSGLLLQEEHGGGEIRLVEDLLGPESRESRRLSYVAEGHLPWWRCQCPKKRLIAAQNRG